MSVVREDTIGIFIIARGEKHRPGDIVGMSHAARMDDGMLKAGDTVETRVMNGAPYLRIKLADGSMRVWGSEYMHATAALVHKRG